MPKNVQMPDGSVVEFPDNMDDNAIGAVLQKQYKQNTSPIPQNVAGLPPGQAPPGFPAAPPVNMKPSDVGQIFGDPGTYAGVPAKHIANMVKGIGGLAAPAQNGGELAASALGPAVLPAYRALVQPSIQPLKDTANYAKQGNWEGARQSVINAVPIAGPWGQAVEDEARSSGGVPAALGMATDIAVPEGASALAGPVGGFIGNKMKTAGENTINRTIGTLKADVKRGQNPGAGYLEAGFGPSWSMDSIASKSKGALKSTGQKLGAAYKNADASGVLIPTDTVRSAISPPIQRAIDTTMGEGGTLDPSPFMTHAQSFNPLLERGDINGGLQPSDVFRAKRNIAENTSWTDPLQVGLKQIRQENVGGLSGVLSDAVPEVAPLNDQYANLLSLNTRATDRAANPASTSLSAMKGHAVKAGLGAATGMAASHSPMGALIGAGAAEALDSVPAKTTGAYLAYQGGKAAGKTGEALSNLQGSVYLFPPKKKKS